MGPAHSARILSICEAETLNCNERIPRGADGVISFLFWMPIITMKMTVRASKIQIIRVFVITEITNNGLIHRGNLKALFLSAREKTCRFVLIHQFCVYFCGNTLIPLKYTIPGAYS